MDVEATVEQARRFPLLREMEAERRLRAVPKCSVLVIDDDEGIRTAMAEILEILGYEVTVAVDGQDAARAGGLTF